MSRVERGSVATALLYLRTVAGLRPGQLVHLLGARIRRRRFGPPSPRSATLDREAFDRFRSQLLAAGPGDGAARIARARHLVSGRLSLLGVDVEFATLEPGATPVSPLWAYHLHYLDWAVDLAWAFHLTGDPQFRDTLMERFSQWDAATRGARGPAWESYPHATRALNLAQLLAIFGEKLEPGLRSTFVAAVAGYAAGAEQGLERHLEGNHLWRDVAAWVVATQLLAGEEWAGGRRQALAWWERVRKSQLLADGGHEERSPLYHALALQDVALTLLLLPAGEARRRVAADAARMIPAWQALLRPDGSVHHFNDSAPRDDFDPPFLAALLGALGLPVAPEDGAFDLPQTGYAGIRDLRGGERVIVDHGVPAPRHQPGHLHCDLLSFECDLDGRAFVVNAGVAGYEGDPLRPYFRGTSSHNTVQVGAYDQSELWGVFRVARMAQAGPHSAGMDGDGGWRFKGTMSPYAPSGVVHHRDLSWRPGRLEVHDEITGGAGQRCRVFLQFAHDVELRPAGPLRFEAVRGTTRAYVVWEGVERVGIHQGETDPPLGWHVIRFGEARPAPCLVAEFEAGEVSRVRCVIERAIP